jgi:hypothetical protein
VNLEKVLEVYSLEEIIEYNDLTDDEVLGSLLRLGILKLPDTLPVDLVL